MNDVPATPCRTITVMAILLAATVAPALAQDTTPRPWGRVSFFASTSQISADAGDSTFLSEFITTLTYRTADLQTEGVEYGFDMRLAGYGAEDRDPRVSMYEAWVGKRIGKSLDVRAGHLWLNDLGGLGAVAGGAVEYQRRTSSGRVRVGGFGGLEPDTYQLGYASNVRKFGAYVALDGQGARRHVAGFVTTHNAGLTERSVFSVTNYLPVGQQLFVYQSAEIDVQGPGGMGSRGLSYFFVNGRFAPSKRVDVQGTYHRGRSIDARSITIDQINGRPVAPEALRGLLFESIGGRVTVEVAKGIRVFGGYGQDRNNREDSATGRLTFGIHGFNIGGSGLDVTVSDSRMDRPNGALDSWYVSVGRLVHPKVYLSGDFTTSLSVVRLSRDGVMIEDRPRTNRISGAGMVYLTRLMSLQVTAERTTDNHVHEFRMLAGIAYRF